MGDEFPFGYRGMIRDPDHETSKKAARRLKPGLSVKQQLVLDVLTRSPDGLTDSELRAEMERLGYPSGGESTYRKRRTELTEKGLVVYAGHVKPNPNGNPEKVWRPAMT
jgi:hypothetical protein